MSRSVLPCVLSVLCLAGLTSTAAALTNDSQSCIDGAVKNNPNCYWFSICVSGAWVTKACPKEMIFSGNQCRFQWTAQCDTGTCIPGTKFANPADCTQYLLCSDNGTKVPTSCAQSVWKWYQFDAATQECVKVWPWSKC